ncbi:MAG: hypothetical protein HY220_00515 [Candidatus Sungbacteria bacterium]|uniref:Uncharacterized protein n=1 Tax=Candidatus Sungiibacteriota bacterium TaxID=2750080 RepID=A0A9D6QY98_9BACT|nr:hypothetical protein [Candidatus Sungbacteria bacterium]
MPKKVVFCLGDGGNGEYYLALRPHLEAAGVEHEVLMDPKGAAKVLLEKRGIPFRLTEGKEDIDCKQYDHVLVGSGNKARDLIRNATENAQKAGVRVTWFCDIPHSGCEEAFRDLVPSSMAVFDGLTRDRLLKMKSALDESKIFVIGNPAFDNLPTLKKNHAVLRAAIFSSTGLRDLQDQLVVYFGSSSAQFDLVGESLEPQIEWVQKNPRVKYYCATHPADLKKDEVTALVATLGSQLITERFSNDDLTVAADMVVTDYSTLGIQSCLIGTPTVFLMGPSAQAYQEKERGAKYPVFPVLDLARGFIYQGKSYTPALGVWNIARITEALDKVLLDPDQWRLMRLAAQLPEFERMADGHAGERFIKNVL